MGNPLDPGTSPFSIEYRVVEVIPVVDDVTGSGVTREVVILSTDDYDIAKGTFAGLKMQCGLRDRSGSPSIARGRSFALRCRVVTPCATVEGTTAFLEAANEGLRLYDLAHGWPEARCLPEDNGK